MNVEWHAATDAGLRTGTATFAAPALAQYSCPVMEIVGRDPGPRLCVMAGVHINEASSIEAAISLWKCVAAERLRGTISIIPIVSTHNLYKFTLVTPPSAGRDLHWSYPGRADGEFNEALAHALLFEWALDADVLLDLHGGDLDERMARYVVVQTNGTAAFDAKVAAIAQCFDTRLVVALAPAAMSEPGRCCTALAREGRFALVAEAGDQGCTDAAAVEWLRKGVSNVARHLGMMQDATTQRPRPQAWLDRYEWITAPRDGIVDRDYKPGDWVRAGTRIGIMRDPFGRELEAIHAPASGCVMMQKTTQFAAKGHWIGSIAVPREL